MRGGLLGYRAGGPAAGTAAGLLSALCPQAEAAGVRLLLAPVMGPETRLLQSLPVLGRLEELSELLRRVDSPALGVCLDTNVMST